MPTPAKSSKVYDQRTSRGLWPRVSMKCTLISITATLVFAVCCMIGCGKRLPPRPSGMPKTTPCTLFVTFGSEKIKDVKILLKPKDKAQKWMAGGTTDAEGKAVMKTGGHFDGVVPGEYTVSFQKTGRIELDKNEMPIRSHSLIPVKYNAGKSKETITVTESNVEYMFVLDGLSPAERQAAEILQQ